VINAVASVGEQPDLGLELREANFDALAAKQDLRSATPSSPTS